MLRRPGSSSDPTGPGAIPQPLKAQMESPLQLQSAFPECYSIPCRRKPVNRSSHPLFALLPLFISWPAGSSPMGPFHPEEGHAGIFHDRISDVHWDAAGQPRSSTSGTDVRLVGRIKNHSQGKVNRPAGPIIMDVALGKRRVLRIIGKTTIVLETELNPDLLEWSLGQPPFSHATSFKNSLRTEIGRVRRLMNEAIRDASYGSDATHRLKYSPKFTNLRICHAGQPAMASGKPRTERSDRIVLKPAYYQEKK